MKYFIQEKKMGRNFILNEMWEDFSTEKKIYQLRKAVNYLLEKVDLEEMARADLEGAEEELSKKDMEAAAKKYIAAAKKRMGTDDPKKIAAGLGATFRKAKDGTPVKVGKVEISDDDAAAFKKEVKSQLGLSSEPKKKGKKSEKSEEELKADAEPKVELLKKEKDPTLGEAYKIRRQAGLLND